MMVVTVAVGEARAGCLVGFGTQTSIDPPRFLACLSRANNTYRVAASHRAATLAVHFLDQRHRALAELFGEQTGDDTDKLARCRWHGGHGGAVLLDDCDHWFVGRVVERLAMLGDHVGFLLEPIAAASAAEPLQELTLRDVDDLSPGHEA